MSSYIFVNVISLTQNNTDVLITWLNAVCKVFLFSVGADTEHMVQRTYLLDWNSCENANNLIGVN